MAIKLKPKSGSKTKTTKSAPKRSTGTKRTVARASKPAAKKAPAKKTTTAKSSGQTRRSPKTDMSQGELNKLLKPLAKAAQKRDRLYEQWKEAVAEATELVVDASTAGVPVVLIVNEEYGNISRQHYYKIMDDATGGKRTNGSKPKAAAKKAVAKPKAKTTAKAPARSRGTKRTVAKKGAAKRRIRAKA